MNDWITNDWRILGEGHTTCEIEGHKNPGHACLHYGIKWASDSRGQIVVLPYGVRPGVDGQ